MADKTEGQEVREAFDGPQLEHDALIGHIVDRFEEATQRSSDSSESSAKTTAFLDETGLNGNALKVGANLVKTLKKKNGQQKAMDTIRSLELIVPMIKNHVEGQGTEEMDLDGPSDDDAEPDDQAEPAGDDTDIPDQVDGAQGDTVTPIDFGENSAAS